MANKGKYQTRKVKTDQINRFRGVVDEDVKHNMPMPYVGAMDNVPSTKIGRMDTRAGQTVDESFDSGINTGAHGAIARLIGEGYNLWVQLLSLLSPRVVALYPPPPTVLPPVLPPLPPPPEEPPPPYFPPPVTPPPFPPPPLPPLPPPPNYNFDPIVYTPETIAWVVQAGYSQANTLRVVSSTFRNWDDLADNTEAEAATTTYVSDGIEYVDLNVTLNPNGKEGYIKVDATVRLAADVAVTLTDKAGYVIFSSGYEYAYVPTTTKVEAATASGVVDVEAVRLAYSERYAVTNGLYRKYVASTNTWVSGDGTYGDKIAPEDMDAAMQSTVFWQAVQSYINNYYWKYIRGNLPADLTGEPFDDLVYQTFEELCEIVGGSMYTSAVDFGFRRLNGGLWYRGVAQASDTKDDHLIADCLNAYHKLQSVEYVLNASDDSEYVDVSGTSQWSETQEYQLPGMFDKPTALQVESELQAAANAAWMSATDYVDITYGGEEDAANNSAMTAKLNGNVDGYPYGVDTGGTPSFEYYVHKFKIEAWFSINQTKSKLFPDLPIPDAGTISGWDLYGYDLSNYLKDDGGLYTADQLDSAFNGMTINEAGSPSVKLIESVPDEGKSRLYNTKNWTALPKPSSYYLGTGATRIVYYDDSIECSTDLGVLHINTTPISAGVLW